MTSPKIRVLPGLLCVLLACTADKDDASTGLTVANTSPVGSTSSTTGTSSGGTGSVSSDAETTAESTTGDTTGEVVTTGDDTTGAVGTTDAGTTDLGTTGSDTSTGEPIGLSWAADIYPVIVANKCGCHENNAGGLTMTNATDSYAILVGVIAWQSGLLRVEPGDPAHSYLLAKLSGTQDDVGGTGLKMPAGGVPTSKANLELLSQWISEGAQP
jgi:hypothetical protein